MEKNQEIVQSGSVNGTMKPNRRAVIVAVWIITMVVLLICTAATRTTVHENGRYHTKKEVALYLYTYKKLPSNYLLKSETEKSGEQPEDGYYIGGDVFRYAKKITEYTEKTDLRECDLDYPENTSRRGQKRLVYAADCSEIFYTDTHYGDDGDPAFVPVKKKDINKTSDIFQAFSIVGAVCGGCLCHLCSCCKKRACKRFFAGCENVVLYRNKDCRLCRSCADRNRISFDIFLI